MTYKLHDCADGALNIDARFTIDKDDGMTGAKWWKGDKRGVVNHDRPQLVAMAQHHPVEFPRGNVNLAGTGGCSRLNTRIGS